VFAAPIISVTVEVGVRNLEWTRRPLLCPVAGGVEQSGIAIDIAVEGEGVQQTVSLSGRGISQVRLRSSVGSGTWALRKVVVVYGNDELILPPGPTWRLSEFLPKPGEKSADFSGLGAVGKLTDWQNGVDGDRLHAYANGAAVSFIRPATEKSVYGGLYCFAFERDGRTERALALLGSRSTDVQLMLPVKMDVDRPLESLSIGYVVRQVKSGEALQTVLSFSWAALPDLDHMGDTSVAWQEMPEAAYVANDSPAERILSIPVRPLQESPYVCFRWCVPKQANSAMIGVAGIRLCGRLRRSGLVFFVR